jgi:DNA-binding GntR family transcriptional regulator
MNESLLEHRAIMAALTARDAVTTVQRMRDHFANGLEAAT